ncbi:hypothetical protein AHAS_Ahas12G0255900 [Arachis hypogaea]
MPKGMSKLKNLQFLSDYVVGKREENKITELGALANLHESISMGKLENVVNSSEALEARMSDKDGIDSIKLTWSLNEEENTVDSEMERDILDKLRPHTNLKELYMWGYRGCSSFLPQPKPISGDDPAMSCPVFIISARECTGVPMCTSIPPLLRKEKQEMKLMSMNN